MSEIFVKESVLLAVTTWKNNFPWVCQENFWKRSKTGSVSKYLKTVKTFCEREIDD